MKSSQLSTLILGGAILAIGQACSPTTATTPTAPAAPAPAVATVRSISVGGSTGAGQVGQTVSLTATAQMSDGTTQSVTATVSWQSSNPAAATVSAAGVVAFLAPGETEVRATASGVTGLLRMTVSAAAPATLRSITVSGSTSGQVGQTASLEATAQLSDGTTESVTNSATWQSSNTAAATVSSDGKVKFLAIGETDIRATVSGVTGSLRISVKAAAVTPMYGNYQVSLTVARQTCAFPIVPGATGAVALSGTADGSRVTITVTERGTTRTYNGSANPDGTFSGTGGGVIGIRATTPGAGSGEVGIRHDYTGSISGEVSGVSISGLEEIRFTDVCPGAALDLRFRGAR